MDTNDNNNFSIKKRLSSFGYAFKGLRYMFRTQHNSRIHLVAAAIVVLFGFIFSVNKIEWCLLIFAMGLVFFAELVNTAIEYLTDIISPGFNEKAGRVKDLAAGAVLISAIASAIIGLIIFIPKIAEYFGRF